MSATDSVTAHGEGDQDAAEQRSALLRRVVVAGGLIAMLIGGLALFDASRRGPEVDDDAAAGTVPSRVEAPAAEESAELPPLPPEETPAVDASTASMQDSPPPLPDAAPDTPPSPAAQPEPEVPESTARPGAPLAPRVAPPAAPARPPAAAASSQARPESPEPAITRSPAVAGAGYVVQVGVFSNVANAEEVRARLALNGIPSQIEARVHIGPFKSRAEADQARQRLRALGMDSGPPTALKPAATQR